MARQTNKIKLLAFKAAAAGLSLLVFILCAELGLRLWGPKYYRFNNRSSEYYSNPRGYHLPIGTEGQLTVYGLDYRSSAERYRLPLVPAASRQKEPDFILGIGDSFTYGRGVKYADIYLSQLQKLLRQDGYQLGVKNCSRIAADLEEIYLVYLTEAKTGRYPLVVYGFVLNDFGLPGKEKIVGLDFIDINNGGYSFNRLRKLSSLYNFFCYLIERKRLHDVTVQAYQRAFQDDYAAEKFGRLKLLNQDIRAHNSRLVIVLFPLIYDFKHYPFAEIHRQMAQFCRQEGILLLDLLPALSRYRAEELWANPTDHHPNEIAHRIVAEELYSFLKQNQLLTR